MRMPCEDKGGDQDNASTCQEILKIVCIPLEAEREAWNRFFHSPQKELTLLIP